MDEQQRERKRASDRASYYRNKQDPEWLARRQERDRIAAQRRYDTRKVDGQGRSTLVKSLRARERYERLRAQVIQVLGGQCRRCHFADLRALQVDHIDGGGNHHRTRVSSLSQLHHMLDNPDMYDLLCANCHAIKTWVDRQVPKDLIQ